MKNKLSYVSEELEEAKKRLPMLPKLYSIPNKKIGKTMRFYFLRRTLTLEAEKRWPMSFPVIIFKRSQAEMYYYGLYSKIARQFWTTHKVKFYKGKVSKSTIKAFWEWIPKNELQ